MPPRPRRPAGWPRLAEVAREAALKAERTVIADTLRRCTGTAARRLQLLGVSYKTLLNKIKETGSSGPNVGQAP